MREKRFEPKCGGYVSLLNKEMEVIDQKYWQTRTDRKEIITTWKRLYGKRFSYMAIQIYPIKQVNGTHKFASHYNKLREDAPKDNNLFI